MKPYIQERRTISVNEVAELIRKSLKAKSVMIESVEVASITNQHTPTTHRVGLGGVLSVNYTTVGRAKERKR